MWRETPRCEALPWFRVVEVSTQGWDPGPVGKGEPTEAC